ncbi:nitrilase-related carbon-nitrogen hydrolase (plasmid) [Bradyrhizobium sp. Pa8]|uniref:nitrilase-related carbon-nitrogen hydrolase n=1 Tax=Bradyrhizobium sp. Pa8 TaxID=3386552 RepID=UPI00403FBB09
MLLLRLREVGAAGTRVVVLSESAAGLWTPTTSGFWMDGLPGNDVTLIAGAAIVDREGYDNVMMEISAGRARRLYGERMPVPVSMWQPWLAWTGQGGGARASFFADPIVESAGSRIAPLICYEQLLVWSRPAVDAPVARRACRDRQRLVDRRNQRSRHSASQHPSRGAPVRPAARARVQYLKGISLIDAATIHQCADPGSRPAIVEKFIRAVGASDTLAVTVRTGNRVILVTPPKTADDAMELVRRYVGQTMVRVGVNQYPAGLGINDISEIKPDLVDTCADIRRAFHTTPWLRPFRRGQRQRAWSSDRASQSVQRSRSLVERVKPDLQAAAQRFASRGRPMADLSRWRPCLWRKAAALRSRCAPSGATRRHSKKGARAKFLSSISQAMCVR